MDKYHKKILLKSLKNLRSRKWYVGLGLSSHSKRGICHYVNNETIFNSGKLEKYFKTWKHYSGSYHYPVPSTIEGMDAHQMFRTNTYKFDMFTKYGRLRWNLLNHIIKELEKELAR